MKRITAKGRTCGWPGVVEGEADEATGKVYCPTCRYEARSMFDLFDHVAYRHPLLVKGESAQR